MINKINQFTDNFIFKVADALAYKSTVLIFTIIAVVPLFFQMPHDILGWQQWLSQSAIQLISLAILAIVSKNEGSKTAKILKETHDTVMQELQIMKEDAQYDKESREELITIVHELNHILQLTNK